MGKGDQKSRRGKIIIGSSGVRRPKSSKSKTLVKVEAVEKIKTVAEKPKAEPKPKVKVAEPAAAITLAEVAVTPEKVVKKAVKKVKEEAAE
jgi:30S ribosomal protein S31